MTLKCSCGAKEDMSHAEDKEFGDKVMVATYLCETCGSTFSVWYTVEEIVFEKGQIYREM